MFDLFLKKSQTKLSGRGLEIETTGLPFQCSPMSYPALWMVVVPNS